MKKVTELRSRNLRHDRNSELVRKMRNGDQLTSFNSQSSWYPPRPTIEKDEGAIRKLYGQAVKTLQPEHQLADRLGEFREAKENHLEIAD